MAKNDPFTSNSSSYVDSSWEISPGRSLPNKTETPSRVQADQKLEEDCIPLTDAPRTEPPWDHESAAAPRRRFPALSEWTWEFVALGLAIGAVVGMFVVIGHFHEDRVPEWRLRSISIGAIISILSLIFRAAIGFIVTEMVGQAKWSWFGQTRPLYDLSELAVLGLVVESPGGRFGMAAALVTLLSFAVGPFAQQAIDIVSCRTPVPGPGLLPAVNFVPKSAREAEIWRPKEGHQIDMDLKNAIFNGFVEATIDSSFASGQNGSFPMTDTSNLGVYATRRNFTLPKTYASIFPWQNILFTYSGAVLSLVIDRPDKPSRGPKPWAAEFGNIGNYSLADITVPTVSDAPCTTDEATGAVNCPGNITSSVLETDYGHSTSAVAVDCRLYTCLRKHQPRAVSGTLVESLSDTIPALPEESYFRYLRDVAGNRTQYRPDKVFNFTVLREPCMVRGSDDLYSRADFDNVQNELHCASSWWLAPLYAGRSASFASLSASMANFSSAPSDSMRLAGAGPDAPRKEDPETPFIRGAVLESTLCIRLIWPWLLLPAVLTMATAAMLAVMIVQGYLEPGQPTWKSSILPLLLYGFQSPAGGGKEDEDGGGGGSGGVGGESRRPELLGLRGVEGISKMVPARFDRDERAFVTAAEWPEVDTELVDRGGRVWVKRLSQDSLLQSR